MRPERLGWIAFALALGCESSPEQPPMGGGGSGASPHGGSGGSGGSTTGGGGSLSPSSGGTAPSSAGTTSGTSGTGGNANSGGTGGSSGAAGSGGTSLGGFAGDGGAGGAAGGGTSGGGSGGTTGCVKNISCKLDPPPSTGDIYQDCVNRINQFLTQCACLPALERRADGEACANQMAEYDAEKNSAHAGAIANICQPGGAQNECPGYASNNQVIGLCMQQMWDEGPPPTSSCTGECYETHGHFINMTDPSVTKVACGFHTTPSGEVWAVQNFSN